MWLITGFIEACTIRSLVLGLKFPSFFMLLAGEFLQALREVGVCCQSRLSDA